MACASRRSNSSGGEGDGDTSNCGSWVELRDVNNATLYTRLVWNLFGENVEVPPVPDGGDFMNFSVCPSNGFIRLNNLANLSNATDLVLYSDVIDGQFGVGPTTEIARFRLP